jgi:hypothetical protein
MLPKPCHQETGIERAMWVMFDNELRISAITGPATSRST